VKEQMTPDAIALLTGALIMFWLGVAVLVRRHAKRRS
jgi:hypothetical protein